MFEVSEEGLIGKDLVHHDKGKCYNKEIENGTKSSKILTDLRRRPLDFKVDEWMFLRHSSMKILIRFW